MDRKEIIILHDHGDGVVHSHAVTEDNMGHSHVHPHVHTQTKVVLNRLARAIGHLEHVKRMVEEERDCTEVLIQLAAVRSALNSTAKIILKDHIEHCISEVQDSGESLKELNDAIDKFI